MQTNYGGIDSFGERAMRNSIDVRNSFKKYNEEEEITMRIPKEPINKVNTKGRFRIAVYTNQGRDILERERIKKANPKVFEVIKERDRIDRILLAKHMIRANDKLNKSTLF